MPEIVHYLERAGTSRYFDEDDFAVLQSVYEKVCTELGVSLENKARREAIALLIFQAFSRSRTPHELSKSVLEAVRNSN